MRVALAGGGTGGHLVPGLHLLEDLAARGGVLDDLVWFTSGRAVEDRVLAGLAERLAPTPVRIVPLSIESKAGGAPGALRQALRMGPLAGKVRSTLREHQSQVFLGLGGFVCGPGIVGAKSAGVPRALLEINAHAGKATRWLAHLSQRALHAWPATMPGSPGERHVLVGAPLGPRYRPPTGPEQHAARRALGFDPERPVLVVLGGSQGAGALNDFVYLHGSHWIAAGFSILLQVGPGKLPDQVPDSDHWRIEEYLTDVPGALASATLVLARGGASTLAEIAACAVPAWVVPYPHHADRHQERNALQLGEGVRVVQEASLNEALAQELARVLSPAGEPERERRRAALLQAAPAGAALRAWHELVEIASPPGRRSPPGSA